MIVLLKIHSTGEILCKICLKAIRVTFFPIQPIQHMIKGKTEGHETKGENSIFWWKGHLIEGQIFEILGMRGRGSPDPPSSPLSGKPYPLKLMPKSLGLLWWDDTMIKKTLRHFPYWGRWRWGGGVFYQWQRVCSPQQSPRIHSSQCPHKGTTMVGAT